MKPLASIRLKPLYMRKSITVQSMQESRISAILFLITVIGFVWCEDRHPCAMQSEHTVCSDPRFGDISHAKWASAVTDPAYSLSIWFWINFYHSKLRDTSLLMICFFVTPHSVMHTHIRVTTWSFRSCAVCKESINVNLLLCDWKASALFTAGYELTAQAKHFE